MESEFCDSGDALIEALAKCETREAVFHQLKVFVEKTCALDLSAGDDSEESFGEYVSTCQRCGKEDFALFRDCDDCKWVQGGEAFECEPYGSSESWSIEEEEEEEDTGVQVPMDLEEEEGSFPKGGSLFSGPLLVDPFHGLTALQLAHMIEQHAPAVDLEELHEILSRFVYEEAECGCTVHGSPGLCDGYMGPENSWIGTGCTASASCKECHGTKVCTQCHGWGDRDAYTNPNLVYY